MVGDFDVDGATSTALVLRCLREFGFKDVDYLVPNRFEYGYGLTPEIVDVAAERSPQVNNHRRQRSVQYRRRCQSERVADSCVGY